MEKQEIKAEIIADSISPFGDRCTSFILTMPRFILAELNTHRQFSRNSASSRAVPFDKMVKRVDKDPFIPIKWMKDHSGMQGDEYFEDAMEFNHKWVEAKNAAVKHAKELNKLGVTKQMCNRILEPFMWHTALVTATQWENFFSLRADPAAEIHIKELAHQLLEIYNDSEPTPLGEGAWHIPFGDKFDTERLEAMAAGESVDSLKRKIATARCARLSYINFEGKDDYEADVKLHDRLKKMNHASPFEHIAKCMTKAEYGNHHRCEFKNGSMKNAYGWCKNFKGFIQYRSMLNNETRSDTRVIK